MTFSDVFLPVPFSASLLAFTDFCLFLCPGSRAFDCGKILPGCCNSDKGISLIFLSPLCTWPMTAWAGTRTKAAKPWFPRAGMSLWACCFAPNFTPDSRPGRPATGPRDRNGREMSGSPRKGRGRRMAGQLAGQPRSAQSLVVRPFAHGHFSAMVAFGSNILVLSSPIERAPSKIHLKKFTAQNSHQKV